MPISSTPSAIAVIESEATSVRRPGLDSAPARSVPGARSAGRQRREAGEAATPSAPAVCMRRRGEHGGLRARASVAIAAASSGPADEDDLELEGVERERRVEPLATDEARQQRPQRGGDRRDREPARDREQREQRGAAAGERRDHERDLRQRAEHRGGEEHARLPDAVDQPPVERGRHADREPRRRGHDADRGVVEALRAQQQDQREREEPVRQPRHERREQQRGDAGDAEQLEVAAQAHAPERTDRHLA